MAIEIKRTPVLKGDASPAFIQSINREEVKPQISIEQVRNAIHVSRQIMQEFKAKVR